MDTGKLTLDSSFLLLTATEILHLYLENLIGFKEARSLLAKTYVSFAEVRDDDIDNRFDEEGEDV